MYNDITIDQFIVDFYSSYSSEIKIGHALEPLDNVDGLDVLIYRTVDCATISRHVMLFDGNPYFNALIKIYNKCVKDKIDQINKESKCYQDKMAL